MPNIGPTRADHRPGDRAPHLRAQAAARARPVSSAAGCASSRTRSRGKGGDGRRRRRRRPSRTAAGRAPRSAARRASRRAARRRGRVRAHARLARGRTAPWPRALRPIGHEDRLSLVEHLDELRTRLIICLVAFLVAFGVCFWQNDRILDIMNRPLEKTAFQQGAAKDPLEQAATLPAGAEGSCCLQRGGRCSRELAPSGRASAAALQARVRAAVEARAPTAAARAEGRRAPAGDAGRRRAVHGDVQGRRLRGAAALAAVPALPGLRVRPAGVLARASAQVALPLMLMVPFLFIAGVVFAYFMVLPPAISFLQNFNDDNFDILLQAQRLLQVRGHGPDRDGAAVPGPGRHPRAHAARDRHAARSCARTAATRSW